MTDGELRFERSNDMKKYLVALLVACRPAPSITVTPPPSASAAVETPAVSPCADATHHDADAAMRAAGLELCWRDAVVKTEGMDGNSEAGFVALVHGNAVLSQAVLGGSDAKGYGWTGEAKFLGARMTTVRGRAIITIRWSQRTGGWSTGAGGSTDIRDVMTAVCTIGSIVTCPFTQGTERELTVTGAVVKRDREAWTLEIGADGVLTATQTKHFEDDGERPPMRVPLF